MIKPAPARKKVLAHEQIAVVAAEGLPSALPVKMQSESKPRATAALVKLGCQPPAPSAA